MFKFGSYEKGFFQLIFISPKLTAKKFPNYSKKFLAKANLIFQKKVT